MHIPTDPHIHSPLLIHSTASAHMMDHTYHTQQQQSGNHQQHIQDNPCTMHNNTCTTHPHHTLPCRRQPSSTHNKHMQTHSWQNSTRCRDDVNVLWCRSHLVGLVFEGSIPTWACFHSENFFVTFHNCFLFYCLPDLVVVWHWVRQVTKQLISSLSPIVA